jgi:flagellar motor switch protein FliN
MNNGISQEEIDRLLASATGTVPSKTDNLDDFYLKDNILPVLITKCYETVASAFSVIISKDVVLNLKNIKQYNSGEFGLEVLKNCINASAPFGNELKGKNFFVFEKPFCSLSTDLFLGGEGKKDKEIDAESKDALKEIISQLLGTLQTALSSELSTNIAFDLNKIDIDLNPGDNKEFRELTNFLEISFDLKVSDIYLGKFFHIVSRGSLEKFHQTLKSVSDIKEITPERKSVDEIITPKLQDQIFEDTTKFDKPRTKNDISNIDLILDIDMPLIVKLGEAEMTLHDVLQLCPGAIIELNRAVDEPVDVIVNNKLVARGEVVVLDSYFALKITEIKSTQDRIKSLGN